jgi:integrase
MPQHHNQQLYQQPNSPFWWFDFTMNGVRVRGSTKQTVRYKAQRVLDRKKQRAMVSGVESLTHKVPTLAAFSVAFLKWVEDTHSIQASTKKFYQHAWKLLSTTKLAVMKLDAITKSACETTTFPGGPWHANQALRTLRRILTFAKETKQIHGDLLKVPLRKDAVGRSVAMTFAQAAAVAAKMRIGAAKDVFLVVRGSGMRPGEVFSMRWEYAKLEAGQYQNPKGKTKTAKRVVPLLGDSLAILKRRHLAAGKPVEGWVFPSDSVSGHMTTIAKVFGRARKAANLPKEYVFYTSRHGAMTDLCEVIPLSEAMKIGGHGDTKTAIGYQHSNTRNLQQKLDALHECQAVELQQSLEQAPPATERVQ